MNSWLLSSINKMYVMLNISQNPINNVSIFLFNYVRFSHYEIFILNQFYEDLPPKKKQIRVFDSNICSSHAGCGYRFVCSISQSN